jgi:hypothetical protein
MIEERQRDKDRERREKKSYLNSKNRFRILSTALSLQHPSIADRVKAVISSKHLSHVPRGRRVLSCLLRRCHGSEG